jgi:hypothetical protein
MDNDFWTGNIVPVSDFSCSFPWKNGKIKLCCLWKRSLSEGAESFVFQQNGSHFDRIPIRVAYRDSSHVVVANDGSIFAGDVIALRGAHQMQMALKNKSGGGVDPHAGHNH